MRRSVPELEYLLTSPENLADPYPGLQRLQEEAPVYWSEAVGGWVISRHDDVVQSFKDNSKYSNEGRLARAMDYLPPERRQRYDAAGRRTTARTIRRPRNAGGSGNGSMCEKRGISVVAGWFVPAYPVTAAATRNSGGYGTGSAGGNEAFP